MRQRTSLTAILIAAVASLAGPSPGHAQTAPRVYTPGAFDAIEISGSAVVRLVQGATDQVVTDGDDDGQRASAFQVRDGTLRINSSGSWKFWNAERLRITVTARELTRVSISGAADVLAPGPIRAGRLAISISGAGSARFDQLKADQLGFRVSGSGDGQMAGTVDDLSVAISGRSDFRGENLMSQRAKVSINGVGDVKVWATQELGVSVSGAGTVDYWGAPAVKRSVSGSATINDRGAKAAVP